MRWLGIASLALAVLGPVRPAPAEASAICATLRYREASLRARLALGGDTADVARRLRRVVAQQVEEGCRARPAPAGLLEPVARWWRLIELSAARAGVDPLLVASVVQVESHGDPRARSHAGAMGLMQLMPPTARELGVEDPYDPEENVDGGTRYLAALLDEFADTRRALAGYHAGPTFVRKGSRWSAATHRYVNAVLELWHGLHQ